MSEPKATPCSICKEPIKMGQKVKYKSGMPVQDGLRALPGDATDLSHAECVLINGVATQTDFECPHGGPFTAKMRNFKKQTMALCEECRLGAVKYNAGLDIRERTKEIDR